MMKATKPAAVILSGAFMMLCVTEASAWFWPFGNSDRDRDYWDGPAYPPTWAPAPGYPAQGYYGQPVAPGYYGGYPNQQPVYQQPMQQSSQPAVQDTVRRTESVK